MANNIVALAYLLALLLAVLALYWLAKLVGTGML